MESVDSDRKYIVFKREEFMQWLGLVSTQSPKLLKAPLLAEDASDISLPDAVVIRRQDLFASPALATYSACIAIALRTAEPEVKAQLQQVADYFQRQSELAADEGWKLPDV